jgi:fucose 4-O-acetylase-like acetyltransferase
MPSTSPSLRDLAAGTPDTRDRFVDAVRAAAILAVVLGHWLIAVITWEGGRVEATNALAEAPALQWLTWGFQVTPLFFVVGGFANRAALLSHRRRGDTGAAAYVRSRILRLSAPVLPLALTWIAAGPLLRLAGVDTATVDLVTRTMAQPLWFLAVYLLVSALAPLTLRLHERRPLLTPVVLAGATIVNDLLGLPFVHQANYLTVFVLAHQLGYALGDGTLSRLTRRHHLALVAAGGLTLAILTGPGPYPRSMVGVPGEAMSNMSPPSVAILALTAMQLGLVLLIRPAATRALHHRRRLWTAVVAVNASIMTIFLWHLSALAIGATLLLAGPLPFPQPEVATGLWWATRLPWLVTMAVVLGGLVAGAGRSERGALRRPSPAGAAPAPWIPAPSPRSPSRGSGAARRWRRCSAST